jgi:predicted ArsR family transcriptional regulator
MLSESEYALLVHLQGVRYSQQHSFITSRDPASLENLVRQLGIPAEMVREALTKLYGKLLVTLAVAPEGAARKPSK